VRLLVDAATRQVLDTYRYAPFGSLLAGGVSNNTRRFTGETQDPTGLYYLRARWYDPGTGRFLTRDPFPGLAALPQTQHPYVYVGNNPVNLVDPGGEIAPILVAVGIGAAIGGVGGGVGYVLAHPGGRPEDYLRSGGFWQAVGIGFASGAVAGAVGWLVPTLLPASGFWGSVGVGALSGSLASGAGQVTANLLNPCVPWYHNLGWALATGGVTGGIAGGVGYGVRQWQANRIRAISPPVRHQGLRSAMGVPPSEMTNPQVHHDLPWEFRDWFAGPRRGLNVNDPQFGRWVEGTPPGQHQNWSRAYRDAWQLFVESNPTADRWQVLAFLKRLLSRGRFQ